MKPEEKQAETYLIGCGFHEVRYEPRGNSKPPDFVVDGGIAVEVRRLNQYIPVGLEQNLVPVEKAEKTLIDLVESELTSLGSSSSEKSWFLMLSFQRPIPDLSEVRKPLQNKLKEVIRAGSLQPEEIEICQNIWVEFLQADTRKETTFLMGGIDDRDAVGRTVEELERSLSIAIPEKRDKMASIWNEYPEWWLILIDHINYARPQEPRIPRNDFNRIILLSPVDANCAFELKGRMDS